jgi:hypothetical protein
VTKSSLHPATKYVAAASRVRQTQLEIFAHRSACSVAEFYLATSLRRFRAHSSRNPTYPVMPLIWKFPKCARYSCSVLPGNLDDKKETGLISRGSASTWCCAKYPLALSVKRVKCQSRSTYTRSRPFATLWPAVGCSSPVKSLILQVIRHDEPSLTGHTHCRFTSAVGTNDRQS